MVITIEASIKREEITEEYNARMLKPGDDKHKEALSNLSKVTPLSQYYYYYLLLHMMRLSDTSQ